MSLGKQNHLLCTQSRIRRSRPLIKVSDTLRTGTRGNLVQCPEQVPLALLPQAWSSSPQAVGLGMQLSQATRANSTHSSPVPFPAADVNWSHGHSRERPSHRHLPLFLRQCSEWGLWNNDLPNEGSGFSFAGIAAQFRLPDAIGPQPFLSLSLGPVASLETFFCSPRSPALSQKHVPSETLARKRWQ